MSRKAHHNTSRIRTEPKPNTGFRSWPMFLLALAGLGLFPCLTFAINEADILQLGSANQAVVTQSSTGSADLSPVDELNLVRLQQQGLRNLAFFSQAGSGNRIVNIQLGESQQALISQSGGNNQVDLDQRGAFNEVNIYQAGMANRVELRQYGNFNQAIIDQFGIAQSYRLTQNGNGNMVRVTQTGF